MRTISSVLLAFFVFITGFQPARAEDDPQPAYVPGRILVKFRHGASDDKVRGILAASQAHSASVIEGLDVYIVELPQQADEKAFVNAFKGLREVEFAELDLILEPQALSPNDLYYTWGMQWNLPKISAPDAWSVTTGSSVVKIAIVDTGVDGTQPDLAAKMVPGWNVYDNNSSTGDVALSGGHGTKVAGIAAAATNNSAGIAGVCWGCKIMPVRVSSMLGSATQSNIATGITWAATHGARVINVGYQVTGGATVSLAAFNAQGNNGCVIAGTTSPCSSIVVAAAGDSGITLTNPDDPNILEIGSSDQNDAIPSWSSKGPFVDLVAPGVSIQTTLVGSMYNSATGTSFAAPHVSGVAGLVLSLNPNLTPSQLIALLKQSVDSLGGAPGSGAGRLNALKAVNNVGGGSKTDTTTTLTSGLNPSTSGQTVTFTATVSPSDATGTVTFRDGATALGTGTLSGGRATYSTSGLAVGSHSITASYGGDSNCNGSTSAALSQTVNKAGTTTTLTSSINPSTSGQVVTFTATVAPSDAAGTVTFRDGATSLGSGILSAGVATFSTSALTVGSHSTTAVYSGDSDYNGSTSLILSQTVNTAVKTDTTTTLTSSLNPSEYGQMVTFTATVAPSAATGTVTFRDGAASLGTVAVSGGRATLSTSSLSVATHSITAVYSGDSDYNGSTSPILSQTVNTAGKTDTTTTLTSSLNPSEYGQMVTFTATVAPSAATGTVTFRDGVATVGTATLVSGRATLSTSTLSVATHSITAVYSGDSDCNGSTSPVLPQTVNAAGKTDTTTTLASSLNPSNQGEMVTFTATVAPSGATGTVTFYDGTTPLFTSTVINGRATLSTIGLSVGTHSITGRYSGDSDYNGSTSPILTQTVNTAGKTNTTTTLTSSLNPSTSGQTVIFTAFVSPSAATGTVTFYDGAAILGTASVISGAASFSTSGLAAGSHPITASYGGNSNYNGSTSPILTQTVNTAGKTNTTTALTSSLNPSTSGQVVTFTAIVSPSAATGTVTFRDGATTLGTVAVSSGMAALSTSSLAAGSHSITASYSGDSNYNASTSGTLTQTVNNTTVSGGDFAIAASPSKATVKAGKTASFTVAITGSGGFTGTVGFSTTGLPVSFSPLTVTGSGSTTMSVPTAGLAKGSYRVTVTGTSGTKVHWTAVVVNVK